jgi:gas vesicle protein
MRRIISLLMGLGIGALAMYLFDPEGGNRRRSLLRDKATKLNRQTREALEGTMADLSNRAKGVAHEVRSNMTSETSNREAHTGWSDGPAI